MLSMRETESKLGGQIEGRCSTEFRGRVSVYKVEQGWTYVDNSGQNSQNTDLKLH